MISHLEPVALSHLSDGQTAVIKSMPHNHAAMTRLRELGLITGTTIKIIRRAPLGDPIEIKVRGTYISLRHTEADLISVESTNQPTHG
jgi:Fe2+ transport system protein FeoA